jgi:hypothetical protein
MWRKTGMKKSHGMSLIISPWFEESMEQERRTEYRVSAQQLHLLEELQTGTVRLS